MPNCDLRDRFVDYYLKLMIDSFSCTPTAAWNFSPKRRLSPDRENSPHRVNLQSVKHEKLSPDLERFF